VLTFRKQSWPGSTFTAFTGLLLVISMHLCDKETGSIANELSQLGTAIFEIVFVLFRVILVFLHHVESD